MGDEKIIAQFLQEAQENLLKFGWARVIDFSKRMQEEPVKKAFMSYAFMTMKNREPKRK